MSSVRIELDSEGIQSLLKSKEIGNVCEKEAEKMTRASGMEYVSDVVIGRTRVVVGAYRGGNSDD